MLDLVLPFIPGVIRKKLLADSSFTGLLDGGTVSIFPPGQPRLGYEGRVVLRPHVQVEVLATSLPEPVRRQSLVQLTAYCPQVEGASPEKGAWQLVAVAAEVLQQVRSWQLDPVWVLSFDWHDGPVTSWWDDPGMNRAWAAARVKMMVTSVQHRDAAAKQ